MCSSYADVRDFENVREFLCVLVVVDMFKFSLRCPSVIDVYEFLLICSNYSSSCSVLVLAKVHYSLLMCPNCCWSVWVVVNIWCFWRSRIITVDLSELLLLMRILMLMWLNCCRCMSSCSCVQVIVEVSVDVLFLTGPNINADLYELWLICLLMLMY